MKTAFVEHGRKIFVNRPISSALINTVPSVDLTRYEGVWYEIATYPQFYEKGCTNVKATYTIKDGYMEILNESIKDGNPSFVVGKGFIVPNSGNAKMKVQFSWPFKGDYWIVELSQDYSWAVVSDPNMKTLWILSRTPEMDEILYDWLIDRLVQKGFDSSRIVMTKQDL